jgi:TonB family protein
MKVLLIEYEPRYVERIRSFLARSDHEVVVARDGDEGLDAYRRSRPDLVLISSVLPKLRTPDVIRSMQLLGPTPPILLMMSGYKGRNKRADAQRVGATSILEKPFGEEAFLAEVAAALGEAPSLELGASGGGVPLPEGAEPLLSADDIFSDIVSGIESAPPPPPMVPPAPPRSGTDPGRPRRSEGVSGISVEKTLAAALGVPVERLEPKSGVEADTKPGMKPAVSESKPGTKAGDRPEAPGPYETLRVNLAELGAPATRPAEKPPEKPRASTSSSVDKLLKDTLSGLNIRQRSSPGGATDPGLAPSAAPATARSGATPAGRTPSSPGVPAAPAPVPDAPATVPPSVPTEPSFPEASPVRLEEATPTVTFPAGAPRGPRQASGPGSFGRFQLLERIASGGMADVFKARMTGEEGFEKIVAIKRILPHLATNEGFITMFVDEAKLAAQLTHNNIIHIYELGKVDAWHYIAMEYVDGKDLRSILKMGRDRGYPLAPELALFIAARIASALDYAHRRPAPDGRELNLVHRDVSPQNILISWEGDIKLCDFGVAKAATKVGTTISGALKGKLQYMSPEQAWGKPVDRRSDIFSLGAVLFEMLAGRNLFEGENDLNVLEKVRAGQVVPPSSVNPEIAPRVDEIVAKALAKEPQDRYQHASELEKDLLSVLYGYQPSPGPADLAIYLHRLLETPPAATDEDIDAAFAAAQRPGDEEPKKGKLLRATRASGEQLAAVLPSALAEPRRAGEAALPIAVAGGGAALDAGPGSTKGRAGLFVGIAVAAVVLVAAGVFVLRNRGVSPSPAAPAAATAAPPATTAAPSPAAPSPAAEPQKVVDQKLVEAEARRLAAETEKARRDAAKKTAAAVSLPAATAVPSPALSLAPQGPLEPPRPADTPAQKPSPQPVAAVEPPVVKMVPPTEPPKSVEAAPAKPTAPPPAAPPAPANVRPAEGDLVGPGEGVVEPKVLEMGAFTGLPPQARQLARASADGSLGTCILMALIDENGNVTNVRVVKSAPYKFVDDAAIRALRNAKIAPATKYGVKVKMWSTIAVTVRL